MDDAELLSQYAGGSREAFDRLVARHVSWVYAAARRMARDANDAEDLTQAVFVLLARKAPGLGRGVSVSGWLFNTLRYAAAGLRRAEGRRRRHEREAAIMADATSPRADADEQATWAQLAPRLESAVAGLGASDRRAVILRFYEGMSHGQVAAALGVSEPAAKKRVARAVERLRRAFAGEGVAMSAPAIAGVLIARVAPAAPAGVAASVAGAVSAAVAGGAVPAGVAGALKGALDMMMWAKVKVVAVAALALLVAPGAVWVGLAAARGNPARPAVAALPVASPATAPASAPAAPPPAWPDAAAGATGDTMVARWHLLADDASVARVKALARPLATKSRVYAAFVGTSRELMPALRGLVLDQPTLKREFALRWLNATDPNVNTSLPGTDLWTDTAELRGPPPPRGQAPLVYTSLGNGSYRVTPANGGRAHVALTYESSSNLIGGTSAAQGVMELTGDLAPGEAVAFVAPLGVVDGAPVHDVFVFQAVRCRPEQEPYVRAIRNLTRWMRDGFGGTLALADDAIAWGKGAAPQTPADAARWTRALPNGGQLRLVAVRRPTVRPFCWWDGDGPAVAGDAAWLPYADLDAPDLGPYAVVQFTLPPPSDARQAKFTQPQHPIEYAYPMGLPPGPGDGGPVSFVAGEAGGAWARGPSMQVGETARVGAGTYSITRVFESSAARGPFPGHMTLVGQFSNLPDVQFAVAGIDRAGAEQLDDNDWGFSIGREGMDGHLENWMKHVPIDPGQLDHFVLLTRPRQWARFEGVASAPKVANVR